jgi:hypothetical protein
LEAIQHAAQIAWLIAVFPVVKGLAQIIYAAFFAESMKTLSDRFTVPPELDQEPSESPQNHEAGAAGYSRLDAPPASVTEHTTEFFEPARAEGRRETQ